MVISGNTGCYYITLNFVDSPTVFVLFEELQRYVWVRQKEGIHSKEIPVSILLLSGINKKCKRLGKN